MFPIRMTFISLVLFSGNYLLFILNVVKSFYFKGLVFSITFICTNFNTLLFSCFIWMSFDASNKTNTDVSKCERILKICGNPENKLFDFSPAQIPQNAYLVHLATIPLVCKDEKISH